MRKSFTLLFTLFASSFLYAQESKITVSSSVRFQKQKTSIADWNDYSSDHLEVTPRLMYNVNNKLGLGIQYSHSQQTSNNSSWEQYPHLQQTSNNSSWSKERVNGYGAFLQINAIQKDNLSIFSELGISYLKSKRTPAENYSVTSYKGIASGINLGGRYKFYKNLGVEIRLNDLISYSSLKDNQDYKRTNLSVLSNPLNHLSFGLSLSL